MSPSMAPVHATLVVYYRNLHFLGGYTKPDSVYDLLICVNCFERLQTFSGQKVKKLFRNSDIVCYT